MRYCNSSQIDFVVTCTADCTGHHPTIRERNWNFWISQEVLNKYGDLSIAHVARLDSLKAFFVLEQRNIYTWLYVTLTRHMTIWHILKKNQSLWRESTRNCAPTRFYMNEVTLAKLTSWWHVPLIVLVTIRHFVERNWNFRVSWEVLNKYGNLSIANVAWLGCVKAFVRSWGKNIYAWLYVTLTGPKEMVLEPKEMALEFDSITPRLYVSESMLFEKYCWMS